MIEFIKDNLVAFVVGLAPSVLVLLPGIITTLKSYRVGSLLKETKKYEISLTQVFRELRKELQSLVVKAEIELNKRLDDVFDKSKILIDVVERTIPILIERLEKIERRLEIKELEASSDVLEIHEEG